MFAKFKIVNQQYVCPEAWDNKRQAICCFFADKTCGQKATVAATTKFKYLWLA